MSKLTLQLPETLHQQLSNLAASEGVSLNQYIVYALTRQVTLTYSISSISQAEIEQQKLSFQSLLQELGKASSSEITAVLAEREMASLEKDLDADTVTLLQQRIQESAKISSKVDKDT